jgi:hypothetical protein
MEKSTVATAVITAVVFGVGGWLLASKPQKVKPPRPNPVHGKCVSGECNVTIKFACTNPSNPTNDTCTLYAEPDLLLIKAGEKIKFALDSPTGHTFQFDPTDGIKFASTKFTCASAGNPQKYKCDNTLTSTDPADAFYYSVHVTGFDVVDPWAVTY